jgi:CheY-like chemotaxis protein
MFDVCGPAPAASAPLAGRCVAVVSTNPIVRRAAVGLLEASGAQAPDFAALDEASASAPPGAVILIDHALAPPGARPRIRPPAGRPCVVLLAPEERGRIPAYRRAGFLGYLIKPLRAESLVERVLAAFGAAGTSAADERVGGKGPSERRAGARVLLVEDNPINALLARSLLEREGCAVDRAVGGAEALAAASTQAYDLILMDLRLPGMDGLAASRALRAMGQSTPIIALTADAFEEDRRACLDAGMDDFLTKPLSHEALRAALANWTGAGWTRARRRAKLAS